MVVQLRCEGWYPIEVFAQSHGFGLGPSLFCTGRCDPVGLSRQSLYRVLNTGYPWVFLARIKLKNKLKRV